MQYFKVQVQFQHAHFRSVSTQTKSGGEVDIMQMTFRVEGTEGKGIAVVITYAKILIKFAISKTKTNFQNIFFNSINIKVILSIFIKIDKILIIKKINKYSTLK